MALTKITSRILDSSGVTILGTIATGVWQGTPINQTYLVGQSGTNTGDETLARINALDVTELGTISSGVWQGSVIAEAYLQNQSGTNTGDQTNISGNAGTATLADEATKLATARNIGGVLFDGSSAIDLPGVNISGNQNTSGNSATVTNGVYIVGNQTIGGAKTFSGIVSINGEGFFRGDSSGNLRIQGGTTATEIRNNANNSSLLTILNGGNVGIGTADPNDGKLQVSANSSGDWAGYFFNQSTSGIGVHIEANSGGTQQVFRTSSRPNGGGNAVTMAVLANGNVGIGTASPSARLQVQGAINTSSGAAVVEVYTNLSSGTDAQMASNAGGANIHMDVNNQTSNTSPNGIIWKSKYANNAGYTKTSAEIKFQPEGNYFRGGLGFYTNGTANQTTNAVERMRISSGGNVLFGGLSVIPSSSVFGSGFWNITAGRQILRQSTNTTSSASLQQFFNPNGQVGSIDVSGSSTSYSSSSDYRLKENVTLITDAISRLNQLKPSRFNFIADADRTVDGFIAHEVQDIIPEAICGEKDAMKDEEYEVTPRVEEVLDEEGNVITEAVEAVMETRSVPDYQGIDQSKIVPLLTAAIQEQQTIIEDLKSRIETLEG